jgi:hypothetical protein
MKALSTSQRGLKDAMNPQQTCSPRVGRRTHSRSLHSGSSLLLLFSLSGAALSIAPTAAAQSVSLTWTASASVVTGYNVYRGTQSGGPYTLVNSSLDTGTTYSDTTVQAGQPYYYVATAVNSNEVESVYSNEAQVVVPYPVVSSQLAFTPASVTFDTFYTGSSTSQTVTLTNTGSAGVVVSGETVTGTGFTASGLSVPQTLAGGQSVTLTVTFAPAAAGSATGTVSVVSNASNSPTSLSLTGTGAVSSHSVALSWKASTSTVAGYNAYRGNQSGGPYTMLNSSLIATTAYTDTTVQGGQTYFYVTAAVNSSGVVSAYSNDVQATVPSSSQLNVSPTSLTFGSITVGSSAPQAATLTNSGPDALTVSQANVTGTGFSISGLSLPLTVAAGQSATFTVTFAPNAAGSATASLSVVSNATNSPATVSLSGTGAGLSLAASPASLSFGNVVLGSTSSPQTVTLTNTGTASVTVSQANVSGTGFSLNGLSLPLTLTAGQTATFNVSFAPTTTGSATGSLSVVSNATNSPATVSFSGTGISLLLSASPASLGFGNVTVGSTTSPQTVTLTNTGTGSVTVSQANLTGAGFSLSGLSLPLTLTSGQTATFNLTFAPTTTGSVTGSVSVVSNATTSPANVSLSGTGVTLLLGASPASIGFGNVTVGINDPVTVSLTNSGTASVTVSQISVVGAGFSIAGISLPITLNAGNSTTFKTNFEPTATGSVTGSLSVVSNATNSPATVSLSGTGVSLLLSAGPASLSFGNVIVGSASSPQIVTLSNTGTASVTVSQANVTGTGFSFTGLTLPLTLSAGQTATLSASFAPTAAGNVTGSLSLTSNATDSPNVVLLSGTGVAPLLTVSPLTLTFSSPLNIRSQTQSVTVTNVGTSALVIDSISLTGTNPTQFVQTNSCPVGGTGLAVGSSCTISLTFAPTNGSTLTKTALLNVNGATLATSQSVSLTGTIVVPTFSLSPTSLSFGNQQHGTISAPQTVTVTNTGTLAPLTIKSIVFGGTNPKQFTATNDCGTLPATLMPGNACTVTVEFAPTKTGAMTASLVVEVAVPASNEPVSLTGTGL